MSDLFTDTFLAFLRNYARYLIAAGVVYAVITILFARATSSMVILGDKRVRAKGQMHREMAYSALSASFFALANVLIVFLVIADVVRFHFDAPVWWILLNFIVMLFAHDAYFYWTHRFMHVKRVFIWAHKTHHRSVHPTPWTAYSFDAAEGITHALFVPLYIALIPTHPLTIVFFVAAMIVKNAIGHSGCEIYPRWWLRNPLTSWVTTVTHHDLHHTTFNYNYGLYTTFWDRIMKTEHPQYRDQFSKNAGSANAGTGGALIVAWMIIGPGLLILLPIVEFIGRQN